MISRTKTSLVLALLATSAAAGTLSAVLSTSAARAQEGAPQEDRKREATALVAYAQPAVDRGSWDDASKSLKEAIAADPANAEAPMLLAWVLAQTGETKAALEVLAKAPTSAAVLARRAELLLGMGDADGAAAAAASAIAADDNCLAARRILAQIEEDSGHAEEAAKLYEDINHRWAIGSDREDTDDDLLAVARARTGLYRVSSEFVANADTILSRYEPLIVRAKPLPPLEALVEAGDLYMRATQDQDALKWYKKASQRNPHWAPAIFGLATQMAFRFDDLGAAREAERALRENPRYVPAILFLAQIALGDGDYEKALPRIEQALAVNPSAAESLAVRAAYYYLRGDLARFDADVKAITSRNPRASVTWRVLAQALEEQRRFADARDMAKLALAADPRDFDAAFLLARNHLNVGEDDLAVSVLTAAEKDDPFGNLYRKNFLQLFRVVNSFPVKREGPFVIRIPATEDRAYLPLVGPALESSLDTLQKKWGFVAEAPTYVSIFDDQRDFATRTIGLPGFPALGACFGRVVTLDSPTALPAGSFGWRGTLHHELAHVITLQLSKGRVPRWLTEGISVYEERRVSPQWNREMEHELVDAIAGGDVLTLDNINNAFRGSRVMFAYYQGGLMCEFIERDFGFPKLREMVRLYGEDLQTSNVVRRALGVEPAVFDQRFLEFAKEFVKDVKVLPRPSSDAIARLRTKVRKDKDDADAWFLLSIGQMQRGDTAAGLDALSKLEALQPKSARGAAIRAMAAGRQGRPDQAVKFAKEALAGGYDVVELRMLLAKAASDSKDFDGAKTQLRKAIELFPSAGGRGAPRMQLAEMLLGEGDAKLDEAMELLRAQIEVSEDDYDTRRKLAQYYRTRSEPDELAMLLQMRDIVPLPNYTRTSQDQVPWTRLDAVELHERLTQLYLARKDYQSAELPARMACECAFMDLGKTGPAPFDDAARADLLATHADVLRLLGRTDEAKRRAEDGLQIAPDNETLRDLVRQLGT